MPKNNRKFHGFLRWVDLYARWRVGMKFQAVLPSHKILRIWLIEWSNILIFFFEELKKIEDLSSDWRESKQTKFWHPVHLIVMKTHISLISYFYQRNLATLKTWYIVVNTIQTCKCTRKILLCNIEHNNKTNENTQ